MIKPSKEFPKMEDLIYALAWRYSRRSGRPFEEIRSEACEAFMKACATYRPGSRTKFSTWCYLKITYHLLHYLRSCAQDRLVFMEEIRDEIIPPPSAPDTGFVDHLREILSPEAQTLIGMLLDRAGAGPLNPQKLLRETLEEFTFTYGIDKVHTRIIIHEIKSQITDG